MMSLTQKYNKILKKSIVLMEKAEKIFVIAIQQGRGAPP